MKKEIIRKIILAFFVFIIIFIIFLLAELIYQLNLKEKQIKKLEKEVENLKLIEFNLTKNLESYKKLFEKLAKDKNLTQLNFNELLNWLALDNTNELIYDEKEFDCSGFALELFKRARNLGIRVGIVEIEFFNESRGGHMLNVFDTNKGIVFIDVTGDKRGKGFDKIAWVEAGMPYITIAIEKIKSGFIDCEISCKELREKGLNQINFILSKEFFLNAKKCYELLDSCIKKYNEEVEKFNRGESSFSHSELKKWFENLKELENNLVTNDKLIVQAMDKIKNIQIYW